MLFWSAAGALLALNPNVGLSSSIPPMGPIAPFYFFCCALVVVSCVAAWKTSNLSVLRPTVVAGAAFGFSLLLLSPPDPRAIAFENTYEQSAALWMESSWLYEKRLQAFGSAFMLLLCGTIRFELQLFTKHTFVDRCRNAAHGVLRA